MPAPGEAAPAQPVRPQEVNRGVLPKREGSAAPLSSPAREFFASYVRDVPPVDQPEGGNIDFEKWRVEAGKLFDQLRQRDFADNYKDRWEKGAKIDDDFYRWRSRMQEPDDRDPEDPETEARLDDVKTELAGGDVAEKLRTAEALEELRAAKDEEVPEELQDLRDAARSDSDETVQLQEAVDALEERDNRKGTEEEPEVRERQRWWEKPPVSDWINSLRRRPPLTPSDSDAVNNNMTRPLDGETSVADTIAAGEFYRKGMEGGEAPVSDLAEGLNRHEEERVMAESMTEAAKLATSVTIVSPEKGTAGSFDDLTEKQQARVQAAREALFTSQMSRINAARKEPGGEDPAKQRELLQELAKDNQIIVDGDTIRMVRGDHRGFTIDSDGLMVVKTDGADKFEEAQLAVVMFDGTSADIVKADAEGRVVLEKQEEVTDEMLSEIFADAADHPVRIWQEDRDVRVRESAEDPSEPRTLRVVNVGSEGELAREKRYFGYPAQRTDDQGRLNLYFGAGSELAGRFEIKLYSRQRYRPDQ